MLYLNGYGSSCNKFKEFSTRIAQHFRFQCVSDPDSCWTFFIKYKQSLEERCILNNHETPQLITCCDTGHANKTYGHSS